MRIMFLNHSFKRHSPQLEAHIQELLRSYASPGTTFELAYPDDLGGGEVLSLLEERKALSGLHHILETPALVQKAIEVERLGFDAVMQSNTFDPGVEARIYGEAGSIICRLVEEYGVAETIKVARPDAVEFEELTIPERFYPTGGHARES